MKLVEKLDGHLFGKGRAGGYRQYTKTRNARLNRRRANRDPEVIPTYRKYKGWEA